MGTNQDLFLKTLTCPVCGEKFKKTKVKTKAIKVIKRDSDFCTYFKGENPYFYNISICPNCGYAATEKEFENINLNQKSIILKEITPAWKKRDTSKERTLEEAINSYKLALYQAEKIEAKHQYIGLLALNLGWLYRYKEDFSSENIFLNGALEHLIKAYKTENFNSDFSLTKCSYLIAEIYNKLGDNKNAIRWYGIALNDGKFDDIQLQKQIREQWQLVSQEERKQVS